MKDYSFTLKVSDLLLHSGSRDNILFEQKFSDKLPGLKDSGIQVEVVVSNLNKEEVLILLENASCTIERSCTRCGKLIDFPLNFTDKEFIGKVGATDEDEDCVCIDEKNETIDLEHPIVDFFILSEPIKILCTDCEQKDIDNESENEQPTHQVTWL